MISLRTRAAVSLALMLGLAACETDPNTGQQRVSNAGTGALGGAAVGATLGAILGGRDSRGAALFGAGIGALAGAAIGDSMDKQEREFRDEFRGTPLEVRREGDSLLITAPGGVGFDPNSAVISPEFRPALDRAADTIARYRQSYVDVIGHADERERDPQGISRDRARVVADYLSDRGVTPARIQIAGRGAEQPLSLDPTPSARAANRRVEIRITAARADDYQGARRRY